MNAIPNAGKVTAAFRIVKVHPDSHRPAHHVFFGHKTPFTTVIAAVTVIAHHEIMALGYDPLAISTTAMIVQQNIMIDVTQVLI